MPFFKPPSTTLQTIGFSSKVKLHLTEEPTPSVANKVLPIHLEVVAEASTEAISTTTEELPEVEEEEAAVVATTSLKPNNQSPLISRHKNLRNNKLLKNCRK